MTETIEWIACADDLPDDDETVLIYVPGDEAELHAPPPNPADFGIVEARSRSEAER